MAYRVGHEPLGASGSAWLLALADPTDRALPRLPPIAGAMLADIAEAGFAHGVLPALGRHLRLLASGHSRAEWVAGKDAATSVAAILTEIDRRLVVLAGQSLLLAHHARRIEAELDRAGLPAAIIKGLVFASRLYPRPAERSFTDIDILAAHGAVDDIGAILRRLGFVPAPEAARDDHAEFKWLLPENDLLLVEVQTDLIHSPSLRAGIHFGHADLVAAGDGDPADATALLMVAAVHGAAGHQFERLQPAIDVLQAARGAAGAIDRGRLVRVARQTGSVAALQSALDIADRLFGEPAARELADALAPAPLRAVRRHLVSPAVVTRAQARTAWRDSWRRRWLRDLIQICGRLARTRGNAR